ncbi:hypothetical protein BMS3Bbin07_00201 [bacterium BMS3Bbin07]|nr:hypothetical protein BMS3Bbin07_00201 [bacterium BMS3Bbin07]
MASSIFLADLIIDSICNRWSSKKVLKYCLETRLAVEIETEIIKTIINKRKARMGIRILELMLPFLMTHTQLTENSYNLTSIAEMHRSANYGRTDNLYLSSFYHNPASLKIHAQTTYTE